MGCSTMVIETKSNKVTVRSILDFVERNKVEFCFVLFNLYYLAKAFLTFFAVVPQFKSIFESMNVELPVVTVAILSISDILVDYWFVALPFAFGVFFNVFLFGVLVCELKNIKYKELIFTKPFPFICCVTSGLLLLAIDIILQFGLHAPMMKLINSVG